MTELYCAKYVMPDASTVIDAGAVAVEGALISGVGSRLALTEKFPAARLRDFGEAVITPGFHNTHTHLELTVMRGYLEKEGADFLAWLAKLTAARLELMTPDDHYVSAAWGAAEAARAGITCVGDASDAAAESMRALGDIGLRGIVYQESFGPDPKVARAQFEALREKVARLREQETALVRIGVSPHAPYTVSPPQLELIADYALAEKLPLMMHAAESAAEDEFVRAGLGPFAERFARRGIEWRATGGSTIQHLAAHGILRTRPLLAHCIRIDEADIETLSAAAASVAHCPKSNAKLGHGRAPLASLIKGRVNVSLGSDSVASNNTCDMLEEARFALLWAQAGSDTPGAQSSLGVRDALDMATRAGAVALGLERQTGVLEEGKQADLAVIALDGAHQQPLYDDPASALIRCSSGRDVLVTVVAGREIYSDGHVNTVDEERLRARMKEIEKKLMGGV